MLYPNSFITEEKEFNLLIQNGNRHKVHTIDLPFSGNDNISYFLTAEYIPESKCDEDKVTLDVSVEGSTKTYTLMKMFSSKMKLWLGYKTISESRVYYSIVPETQKVRIYIPRTTYLPEGFIKLQIIFTRKYQRYYYVRQLIKWLDDIKNWATAKDD